MSIETQINPTSPSIVGVPPKPQVDPEVQALLNDPVKALETLSRVEMQIEVKLQSLKPEIERLSNEIKTSGTEEMKLMVDKITNAASEAELNSISLELESLIENYRKQAIETITANPDLVNYIKNFK